VLLMVYIGGVHHFIGAILGAVAITWLQVSLSDYTTAWLLYLGLLFMGIVAYLPGGLAGIVIIHLAALRARVLAPIVRSYLVVLPFALAAAVGAIVLIEIAYRRSTQPEAGTVMTLFWMSMDTSKPWPWLAAVALMVAGGAIARRLWTRVHEAWNAVAAIPSHA
jgi:branched-chain amino acid transport system permease protein